MIWNLTRTSNISKEGYGKKRNVKRTPGSQVTCHKLCFFSFYLIRLQYKFVFCILHSLILYNLAKMYIFCFHFSGLEFQWKTIDVGCVFFLLKTETWILVIETNVIFLFVWITILILDLNIKCRCLFSVHTNCSFVF